MESDEIPARIRAVAKKSGRLAAPHAQSLIAELDRNEALRQLALQRLDPAGAGADSRPSASEEFLRRDPGWEERFAELAELSATEAAHRAMERLQGQLAKARKEIDSLRGRLRRVEKAPAPAVPPHRKNRKDDSGEGLRAVLSEKERALLDCEAARRELLAELAKVNERVESLRRTRRERTARSPTLPSGMRSPPIDLARDLDARLSALTISPANRSRRGTTGDESPPQPLTIPAGIRPDSAAAIDWLLARPDSLTVAVDGWNLAFQFKSPPGKRERRRVEVAVGRLSHRAAGERKLLVLFDSRFDLPGTYASTHPQVEVSFPASADEALIELAGQQANLVVITSDRRVREEAGRRGAVGLWGEALIDWLQ
jgi:hypothetical protein